MRKIKKVKYQGYNVYSNGVVLNKDLTPVKDYVDLGGYQYILVPNPVRAHRFIWSAFNGEIEGNLQVDHINNDRLDNSLENLQLMTSSENSIKARANSDVDRTMKSIGVFDRNGKMVASYKSATEAERLTVDTITIKHQRVSECIRGIKKDHRKLIFKRVDLEEVGYYPSDLADLIPKKPTLRKAF